MALVNYLAKKKDLSGAKIGNEGEPKKMSVKHKFKVSAHVSAFSPEDLSVKTVNGCVLICAKHAERKDAKGALVIRDFTKRYKLPDGCVAADVRSELSPSGILTVFVPGGESGQSSVQNVPIIMISNKTRDQANASDPKPGPGEEASVNNEE